MTSRAGEMCPWTSNKATLHSQWQHVITHYNCTCWLSFPLYPSENVWSVTLLTVHLKQYRVHIALSHVTDTTIYGTNEHLPYVTYFEELATFWIYKMKRSQKLQHWWSFVNVMQSWILLYVSLYRILHSCGGITIRSTDRLKLLTYRNYFFLLINDQLSVWRICGHCHIFL